MTKPPLLMIVGLGHSGTTILDATLGCSTEIVGIGEATRVCDVNATGGGNVTKFREGKYPEIRCTCGETVETCPVWSKLTAEEIRKGTFAELYRRVYDAALEASPNARFVLDSTPGGMKYVKYLKDYDLRIILLTRDARSWTASLRRREKSGSLKSYKTWKRGSRRVERTVEQSDLPYFKLGYEEFALRPKETLGMLCDWIGVPYEPNMLRPAANTGSHIITGNAAIRHKNVNAEVRYDARWLTENESSFATGLLYASVASQNRRMVYSNGVIDPKG